MVGVSHHTKYTGNKIPRESYNEDHDIDDESILLSKINGHDKAAHDALGIVGEKGDKGDTGDVGPQGPQGLQGEQGIQGLQGETGATGSQGTQGETGLQGEPGIQGETGSQGVKGDTGDIGPKGDQGNSGTPGTTAPDLYAYRKIGTTQFEAWHTSPATGTALTTATFTANRLYAMPFIVPRTITLDRIGVNVTTLIASSLIRLGIYANNNVLGLYPGSLILDAGTIASSAAGVKTITIDQQLTAGLYWLVAVSGHAPVIRGFAVASAIPLLGISSALGTAMNTGLYVAFTMGTLPTTFPSTPTMLTAVPLPAIFVRLSA